MKNIKKVIAALISCGLYLVLTYLILYFPIIIKAALKRFIIQNTNLDTITIMITVSIMVFFSSDFIYKVLHRLYVKGYKKTKNIFIISILVALISFNDFIICIPKRTLIFTMYLFLTVAKQMGADLGNADLLFVGVFLISLDRVYQNWGKEKNKLYTWGKKAYSDEGKITDEILK